MKLHETNTHAPLPFHPLSKWLTVGLDLLAIVSSSIQLWSVNTVSALNKSCKTSKNLFQLWKTNCELEVCVPTDTQFLFVEQSTYGYSTFISYRSGINKIIKL